MSDSYALLMLGDLPIGLFEDMQTAKAYANGHDRIDDDEAYVWWPVRVKDGGDDE